MTSRARLAAMGRRSRREARFREREMPGWWESLAGWNSKRRAERNTLRAINDRLAADMAETRKEHVE